MLDRFQQKFVEEAQDNVAAIEEALQAIAQIPEPFAQSAKSGEAQNAVKVVGTDLVDVLTEVNTALSR